MKHYQLHAPYTVHHHPVQCGHLLQVSTLLQALEEPFLSCHVTKCFDVNVRDVASCGAFHASYQTKIFVEAFAELFHLCRTYHLCIVLPIPVWALGGKVSWLVADKTLDLGHVNVLLTTLLLLCLALLLRP